MKTFLKIAAILVVAYIVGIAILALIPTLIEKAQGNPSALALGGIARGGH